MKDRTIQRIREKDKENVQQVWDSIAKPVDGLGEFERIVDQIGAIFQSVDIDIGKKAVLVFCADNGIVAEGVSQSTQEVTALVAKNMGMGITSVCKMARWAHMEVIPIDIGINQDTPIEGVRDCKIAKGTKNFLHEPAMTSEEVIRAIQVGMELVEECKQEGFHMLAIGEMGIGNTTTSSAVAAALLQCPADAVTGRGAGIHAAGLRRKKQVIQTALEQYALDPQKPLEVLAAVGGLDIAGMVGVCMGGAHYRIPVVLDGVISMVAALAAERLQPGTVDYLIASHSSREPAAQMIAQELGLKPVLYADMALGEGTGAVMMCAMLDLAMTVYGQQTTFEDIKLQQYERFE